MDIRVSLKGQETEFLGLRAKHFLMELAFCYLATSLDRVRFDLQFDRYGAALAVEPRTDMADRFSLWLIGVDGPGVVISHSTLAHEFGKARREILRGLEALGLDQHQRWEVTRFYWESDLAPRDPSAWVIRPPHRESDGA